MTKGQVTWIETALSSNFRVTAAVFPQKTKSSEFLALFVARVSSGSRPNRVWSMLLLEPGFRLLCVAFGKPPFEVSKTFHLKFLFLIPTFPDLILQNRFPLVAKSK